MSNGFYTSDLTDAEWAKLEPLLPPDKVVGRLREVDLREVVNAIYYRADNGVKWRNLPMIFRLGKQSMDTFAPGCAWGSGKTSIRPSSP
jgi:transposase